MNLYLLQDILMLIPLFIKSKFHLWVNTMLAIGITAQKVDILWQQPKLREGLWIFLKSHLCPRKDKAIENRS